MPIKSNRPIPPILRTRESAPLGAHTTCTTGQKKNCTESKPCRKKHVLVCVSPYILHRFFFFFPPFISCFFPFYFCSTFSGFHPLHLPSFFLVLSIQSFFFFLPLVFRFYSFLFHSFTLFVFVLTLCLVFFQIPLPPSLLRRPHAIVLKSLNTNGDNDTEDPVWITEG